MTKNHYHNNPYHNFRHVVDVAQALYSFLVSGKSLELLSYVEIFALLVTTFVHDLGHPGVNNAFLIATEDALSLEYNDQSPLENFHCASAWSILTDPSTNIIEGLSSTERSQFRQIMISSILITDPSRTMEVISKFEGIKSTFDQSNFEHRTCFCHLLLKCADVSNPTRPFAISRYWAEMIQAEFYLQVSCSSDYIHLMDTNSLSGRSRERVRTASFPLYGSESGRMPPSHASELY